MCSLPLSCHNSKLGWYLISEYDNDRKFDFIKKKKKKKKNHQVNKIVYIYIYIYI